MNIKQMATNSAQLLNRLVYGLSGGRFQFFYANDRIGFDSYDFGQNKLDRTVEGYGQNPYVFMVINRIVQRAIDIEFSITDDNGEVVESPNPNFQSIIDLPNQEGLKESLFRIYTNFLVGETFVVKETALGFDRMTGFFVPNSQDVFIVTDSNGNVASYDITYRQVTKKYAPDEVLHIKKPNITKDEYYGISNLQPGRFVYKTNNEVWATEASLHKNKGVAGILHGKGRPIESKERKVLQEQYDKEASGRVGFGKVRVSSSEVGYIPMGMNSTDLQSIQARLDHLRAICALYSVDPRLFGDPQGSTYNNMRESKAGLIIDAVIPMMRWVLPELVRWISIDTGDRYGIMVDKDGIPEMQVFQDIKSARIGREVIQGILPSSVAMNMLYPELSSEEETATTTATPSEIASIVQQVNTDQISRESAISIMMVSLSIDEETANEILG